MKWVVLIIAVALILIGCKGMINQSREQHIQYKKEVCPCECTK